LSVSTTMLTSPEAGARSMPLSRTRPWAMYLRPSLRKHDATASIGPAVIRAWQPGPPLLWGGPSVSSLACVPGGSRWKVSMLTCTRLTFSSEAETISFHGPAGGSSPVTEA